MSKQESDNKASTNDRSSKATQSDKSQEKHSSIDAITSLLDAEKSSILDDADDNVSQQQADESVCEDSDSQDSDASDQQHYQAQAAKIASLEEKLQQAQERCLRIRAEADNIQRRADKAVADAHRFGNEKLAKHLLEVVDSLERALTVEIDGDSSKAVAGLHEGVELTLDMLLNTLAKFSIEVVNPEGQPFDPQLHEAMAMQPAADGVAANTVLNVIQKGYTLHGRLLRPARVIVAK